MDSSRRANLAVLAVITLFSLCSSQSCIGPGFDRVKCDRNKAPLSSGQCGIGANGAPCKTGGCCSSGGYCGRDANFCGGEDKIPPPGPIRSDGHCGAVYDFAGCPEGYCCSPHYSCGNTRLYCPDSDLVGFRDPLPSGRCGSYFGWAKCAGESECCSKSGWCGDSQAHCAWCDTRMWGTDESKCSFWRPADVAESTLPEKYPGKDVAGDHISALPKLG